MRIAQYKPVFVYLGPFFPPSLSILWFPLPEHPVTWFIPPVEELQGASCYKGLIV